MFKKNYGLFGVVRHRFSHIAYVHADRNPLLPCMQTMLFAEPFSPSSVRTVDGPHVVRRKEFGINDRYLRFMIAKKPC